MSGINFSVSYRQFRQQVPFLPVREVGSRYALDFDGCSFDRVSLEDRAQAEFVKLYRSGGFESRGIKVEAFIEKALSQLLKAKFPGDANHFILGPDASIFLVKTSSFFNLDGLLREFHKSGIRKLIETEGELNWTAVISDYPELKEEYPRGAKPISDTLPGAPAFSMDYDGSESDSPFGDASPEVRKPLFDDPRSQPTGSIKPRRRFLSEVAKTPSFGEDITQEASLFDGSPDSGFYLKAPAAANDADKKALEMYQKARREIDLHFSVGDRAGLAGTLSSKIPGSPFESLSKTEKPQEDDVFAFQTDSNMSPAATTAATSTSESVAAPSPLDENPADVLDFYGVRNKLNSPVESSPSAAADASIPNHVQTGSHDVDPSLDFPFALPPQAESASGAHDLEHLFEDATNASEPNGSSGEASAPGSFEAAFSAFTSEPLEAPISESKDQNAAQEVEAFADEAKLPISSMFDQVPTLGVPKDHPLSGGVSPDESEGLFEDSFSFKSEEGSTQSDPFDEGAGFSFGESIVNTKEPQPIEAGDESEWQFGAVSMEEGSASAEEVTSVEGSRVSEQESSEWRFGEEPSDGITSPDDIMPFGGEPFAGGSSTPTPPKDEGFSAAWSFGQPEEAGMRNELAPSPYPSAPVDSISEPYKEPPAVLSDIDLISPNPYGVAPSTPTYKDDRVLPTTPNPTVEASESAHKGSPVESFTPFQFGAEGLNSQSASNTKDSFAGSFDDEDPLEGYVLGRKESDS